MILQAVFSSNTVVIDTIEIMAFQENSAKKKLELNGIPKIFYSCCKVRYIIL